MSKESSSPRTWLITGASKGFGQALVDAIASRGERVVGTFRNPEQAREFEQRHPGVGFGVELDVTDAQAIPLCIQQALDYLGHIDVLVNNAGYGQFGALEDLSDEQVRRIMETNFFGVVNMTRALLPHFRDRRAGRIVNITSVAGIAAFAPGASVYTASKFAVEGLSEALAMEIGQFGIGLTTVEPGAFRTEFGASSMDMAEKDSADYQAFFGPVREYLATQYAGTEPGDPVKAAGAILQAMDAPEPPARLVLGEDAVQAVKAKLQILEQQLAAYESLSLSTGFDD